MKQVYECVQNQAGTGHVFSEMKGKITFTLTSKSDEIHQKVELPRLENLEAGREIFATWQPIFKDNKEPSDEYLTDCLLYTSPSPRDA